MSERPLEEDAAELIARCSKLYTQFSPGEDLASGQVVSTYTVPENQLKYVHMYFAKYVTLWSEVRRQLAIGSGQLTWSIGAGPMLCLLGWFWHQPRQDEQVVAIDALDWSAVRSLAEWQHLVERLIGNHEFYSGMVIPRADVTTQGGQFAQLTLSPEDIPSGAIVLLPFILNHLLGAQAPLDSSGRQALREWVDGVRSRARYVIIADMQVSRASSFWEDVRWTLDVSAQPRVFNIQSPLGGMLSLYRDGQGSRRCSKHMSESTVLMLEGNSGYFL